MITEIGESIKVGVVFGVNCIGGKKIKPVWFIWKERQYRIKEVTYTWTNKEGSASVHYFSVTDDQNLYEIAYNTETMVWRLMAVEVEG
jgi:hypothetical protein